MQYNVNFEICTLIFVFVLMICFFSKTQLDGKQSRTYRIYLLIVFFDLLLDILSCFTIEYYKSVPLFWNMVVNTLFLMMQALVPAIFLNYVHTIVQKSRGVRKRMPWWVYIPMGIVVVFLLLNPMLECFFYFDAQGYQHGPYHSCLYVSTMVYVVGMVVYTVGMHKAIPVKQRLLLFTMIFIATLMTALQFFFPSYSLAGVGLGVSVFIMYLTLENPTIYEDTLTGALNREAFIFQTRLLQEEGKPFQIFAIALDNFKIINEVFGMAGGNRIMQLLVEELHRVYAPSHVFRFNGDIFTVVVDAQNESNKELDTIRKILRKSFVVNGVEVELSACICLIHSEHCTKGESELVKALDYSISEAKSRGKGQYFEMDDESVTSMARKAAIEQALVAAVEKREFEVHYQPIYDLQKQQFRSMEALARLQVPGYGYVSPEEFIRIAEQNGMIIEIGILVLEEVCRLVSENHLEEMGIAFVEVNLSVVQCMQEEIYEKIIHVLEKYDVPPRMINLEITESAAAYSQETLVRNMAWLSLRDITFSLDDYGSGYSNVNYLVDLPFSIVKLDKYMVWSAFKQVKMRKVLENTISMFKDINLKVVAEGIETREMAEALSTMGVDYIQGYYYAKPMPANALLELLQGENA